MANIFKAKTLLGRTGIFSHEVIAPNLVYNTGNQTIEGIKDFNNIINVSGVKFDVLTTSQTPTHQEGVLYYSDDNKTLNLDLDVVDLKLLIGQENLLRAKNSTSNTMSAGTVVYINGAQGNTPLVERSIATGDSTSARTVGIAAHSINNNSKGYFTTFGLVEGVDTSAYSVGQALYLSPQISGGLTGVKPQAPDHTVRIGEVINQGANGSIFVNIQNGFEIEELHNVRIINPQNKDGIVYNSASGLWLNIPVLTGNESLNQSLNELNINNIVYTTGNQTISGIKTFAENTTFGDPGEADFLVISGNNFTVYGSGNFTSGLFVNGNAVLTGVDLSSYATTVNLASTGSTLDTKINNVSGYAAPKDIATTINISSDTISLDLSTFSYFLVNLNSNITTTNFNNPKVAPEVTSFVLQLSGDGTIRSVTWPTSLRWPGNTAPTITIGPDKVDTYSIFSYDGGVSYYGFPAGYNS